MTERKLLALALAATMSMAFLTGMGTYGFLTDSESVRISLSGNVAGNQTGNTPTLTSGTALGPSSAGTENPNAEFEREDTDTPMLTNTSDPPTRSGENRLTVDESGTSPTTDTTSTRSNESSENQDGGVGAGNDDDGGAGAILPTDPGNVDLLVPGRNR